MPGEGKHYEYHQGLWNLTDLRRGRRHRGVFRENKRAEVQAIGAIAVNQAIKALALAKNYLKEDGYDIVFIPEFVDVEIDDKVRTAIKFVVEPR